MVYEHEKSTPWGTKSHSAWFTQELQFEITEM